MRTEAARAAVRLAAVDLHEPKAARRILEAQQRADVAAPVGVGAAVPKRRATCLAVLRSPLLPERAPRERQARAAAGTCEDEAWCVRRRRSAAAAAAVQEQSGRRSDGSDAREGDLLRAGGHLRAVSASPPRRVRDGDWPPARCALAGTLWHLANSRVVTRSQKDRHIAYIYCQGLAKKAFIILFLWSGVHTRYFWYFTLVVYAYYLLVLYFRGTRRQGFDNTHRRAEVWSRERPAASRRASCVYVLVS